MKKKNFLKFIKQVKDNFHLNIVSFDVPYPPNYGGVIDIYYKIKALHRQGVKVHLHCFEYGRKPQKSLEEICESVNYYKRKTEKSLLFGALPYIVLSRVSEQMKKNLLSNDYPVLMEGIHSTYYLNDDALAERKTIVRTHNIEHLYYESLARIESNIFKRYYFYNEAAKLKRYHVLRKAGMIAAISKNDADYFSKKFINVKYIPPFHQFENVEIENGRGDFALYHGNLSVGENNEAALFLLNNVFNDLKIPFIIAGSHPSNELIKAVKNFKHIQLKSNAAPAEINLLIRTAHINVLPTFQATGIKLKLLSALFLGRHCIVNSPMVNHTGLESLCTTADSAEEMKAKIQALFETPFSQSEIEERKKILLEEFSNEKNARKLIAEIFTQPAFHSRI